MVLGRWAVTDESRGWSEIRGQSGLGPSRRWGNREPGTARSCSVGEAAQAFGRSGVGSAVSAGGDASSCPAEAAGGVSVCV